MTFDYWNTLVVEPPGLLSHLRRAAVGAALGDRAPAVDLDALLRRAGRIHDVAWHAGDRFRPEDAASALIDALAPLSPSTERAVAEAYLSAGRDAELRLTPGAAETIRALASAGIPLAIVCDVGLTGSVHLRRFLDRHRLLAPFSGWAFSDEVGTFKPGSAIFLRALERLGSPDPATTVHVGDLRRTDVAGARRLGMRSIRYSGVDDDRSDGPEADLVTSDLRDLTPELLRDIVRSPAPDQAPLTPHLHQELR